MKDNPKESRKKNPLYGLRYWNIYNEEHGVVSLVAFNQAPKIVLFSQASLASAKNSSATSVEWTEKRQFFLGSSLEMTTTI